MEKVVNIVKLDKGVFVIETKWTKIELKTCTSLTRARSVLDNKRYILLSL